MALSTNQKMAIAVGITATVVLVGASALAKPRLNFNTRNINALNAVVDAMVADPNLNAATLTQFADHLSYYGLQEQEQKIRARAKLAPKVDKTVPFHGF